MALSASKFAFFEDFFNLSPLESRFIDYGAGMSLSLTKGIGYRVLDISSQATLYIAGCAKTATKGRPRPAQGQFGCKIGARTPLRSGGNEGLAPDSFDSKFVVVFNQAAAGREPSGLGRSLFFG